MSSSKKKRSTWAAISLEKFLKFAPQVDVISWQVVQLSASVIVVFEYRVPD